MNIQQGVSKGAVIVIIMVLTSFFAAGILTFTFVMNPNFIIAMYQMGLWGMVYTFMGVWFIATCATVILVWLVLKKRVTIGDAIAG